MNSKHMMPFVAVMAAMLLGGCYQRVEVASTPCDALGKTTDPVAKADLEERCGHGGPKFKRSPPKAY